MNPAQSVPVALSPNQGVDAGNMATMQNLTVPSNMDPKAAAKLPLIVADLRALNPGLSPKQAHLLAVDSMRRYPEMYREARGGDDWIEEPGIEREKIVVCPQCNKEAFAVDSSHCHFCGYAAQPGTVGVEEPVTV